MPTAKAHKFPANAYPPLANPLAGARDEKRISLVDGLEPALEALLPARIELDQAKNMDDFIKFGRYSVLILFLLEFVCLSTLSTMIFMIYAGHNPTVTGCERDGVVLNFDSALNQTQRCSLLKEERAKSHCKPHLEYQFHSINIDFDLICEDGAWVRTSTTMQMSAVFVGALLFGHSSDWFGRRTALMIALVCSGIFTGLSAFAADFIQFNVWRICTGFFAGGITAVQGVYLVENIPLKHRMLVNTIVTWSPNFIIYPILAYFSGDWRTLALVSAAVNAMGVATLIFCYESPRFLIQKGRIGEARKVLTSIRRFNRDTCATRSQDIEEMLIAEQKAFTDAHRVNHTFLDIARNAELLRWTCVLCFGIMTTSLINYGILFNMDAISGSLYLNNIFFGIIRWGLNICVGLSDFKIPSMGRKFLNTASEISNLACLVFIFVVYFFEQEKVYTNAIRIVAISVTAACGQVYIAKYITATELYPTSVRNLGCSAQAMFSRIGTILSTQLFRLDEFHDSFPYFILCICLFADIFLFQLCIPETKGRKLTNHLVKKVKTTKDIEQAENS